MAEVIRYINLASTAGGDGTTNNTAGSTRAYASVSEWESAEQTDLVSDGDYHHVFAEGGESLEAVTIAGWTTNQTSNYIIFEVATGSRSDGTFGSGFRLRTTGGSTHPYQVQQDGTITVGLEATGSGTNADGCRNSALGNMYLFCLFAGNSSSGVGYQSLNDDGGFVFSTIVKDTNVGFDAGNFDAPKWYNNTVINCGTSGIVRAGSGGTPANIANNAVFGSGTSDYNVVDTLTAASTNNASEDLTAVGSSPLTGLVSGDFTNISGGDFSITDDSSALYDAGADISTAVSSFDRTDFTVPLEDIIGTERPQGSSWDIGAFELIASGGETLTAASGTYSYSGSSVNLITDKILTANSGSYSCSGTNVNLLKGFLLTCDSGSYLYSGSNNSLTYTPLGSNILNADSGVYVYNGANINFSRDRVMIASSGSYNYQGDDIQIILPGQVWTDKASANTVWGDNELVTTTWTDK